MSAPLATDWPCLTLAIAGRLSGIPREIRQPRHDGAVLPRRESFRLPPTETANGKTDILSWMARRAVLASSGEIL